MRRIDFDLGERRHVLIDIRPEGAEKPFRIVNATWELILKGEVEASGVCAIEERQLDVFLEPKTATRYTLKLEYDAADEHYVDKLEVSVV